MSSVTAGVKSPDFADLKALKIQQGICFHGPKRSILEPS